MEEAKSFTLWFLQNIPSFFTTEPLSSFIGFAFLAVVIRCFRSIVHIGKFN